jgi:hypothetical protein
LKSASGVGIEGPPLRAGGAFARVGARFGFAVVLLAGGLARVALARDALALEPARVFAVAIVASG